MIPIDFEQSNFTFGPPRGVSEEECGSLKCYKGTEEGTGWSVIVSAWQPSPKELEEINRTGIVWLRIYSEGMCPVSLSGESPWKENESKAEV